LLLKDQIGSGRDIIRSAETMAGPFPLSRQHDTFREMLRRYLFAKVLQGWYSGDRFQSFHIAVIGRQRVDPCIFRFGIKRKDLLHVLPDFDQAIASGWMGGQPFGGALLLSMFIFCQRAMPARGSYPARATMSSPTMSASVSSARENFIMANCDPPESSA